LSFVRLAVSDVEGKGHCSAEHRERRRDEYIERVKEWDEEGKGDSKSEIE
jgi:hypothetical protein